MGYLIPVTPQAFVNIISWCEKDFTCVKFVPIIYRFHYCNEHFYTITNLELYELACDIPCDANNFLLDLLTTTYEYEMW